MTREIKFRHWDGLRYTEAGMWFSNTTCTLDCAPPGAVEQFTGLKDKNGVEIYEGDIVRCGANEYGNPGEIYEVIYQLNAFVYVQRDKPKQRCYVAQHLTEVIGNVHSNPELLK